MNIKPIFKNSFLLSVSQIFARILGFIYIIFLARSIGIENFGIYTFTIAFVYNFAPITDFGIDRYVLRELSRHPELSVAYFAKLVPLRFFLTICAYLLVLLGGLILKISSTAFISLALFGLVLFPGTLISLITNFQNAKEKMEYSAFANIATIVLTLILGYLFVQASLPLLWIIGAYVLGYLLVAVVLFFKLDSFGLNHQWNLDITFIKDILISSWPFAAMALISAFYLKISLVLVELIQGDYLTGIYASAFKFIEAFLVITQSLSLALFPISSRLFEDDKKRLKKLYFQALIILLFIALPLSIFLLIFAKDIIYFAYGSQYQLAVLPLSILGVSLIFFFLNSLVGNIIQNSNKIKSFLLISLLYLLAVTVIAAWFISRYSIVGASIAVLIGEIVGLVINNIFIWRILHD
jgi:O-antigen/teichoic acid export membrane protein